jgi:hypothetical protein
MLDVTLEVSSRKILNFHNGVMDEGDGQQKQHTGNTIKYIKTKCYMCSAVFMFMYKHGVICCILCHYFCQYFLIAALPVLVFTINGSNLSTSHVKWSEGKLQYFKIFHRVKMMYIQYYWLLNLVHEGTPNWWHVHLLLQTRRKTEKILLGFCHIVRVSAVQ